MKNKLTFLFDGGCPLCLRETNFLKEANLFTHSSIIKPSFTWPSFLPNFMGIQIDHILFSKNFKIMNIEVLNHFSSDHRALFSTLVLENKKVTLLK